MVKTEIETKFKSNFRPTYRSTYLDLLFQSTCSFDDSSSPAWRAKSSMSSLAGAGHAWMGTFLATTDYGASRARTGALDEEALASSANPVPSPTRGGRRAR